jgi:hypothetical protein
MSNFKERVKLIQNKIQEKLNTIKQNREIREKEEQCQKYLNLFNSFGVYFSIFPTRFECIWTRFLPSFVHEDIFENSDDYLFSVVFNCQQQKVEKPRKEKVIFFFLPQLEMTKVVK